MITDEIVGQRFGKLVVERFSHFYITPSSGKKEKRWLCRCDCGGHTVTAKRKLKSGHTTSCGCYRDSVMKVKCPTHGMTKTPEYISWLAIKARCYNKNEKCYENYGGRGIKVCERWLESFENFYADMGPRPEGMSLERKNVDGDYEPSNCEWATATVQSFNRRHSLKNKEGRVGISKHFTKTKGYVWKVNIAKNYCRRSATVYSREDAVKLIEKWEIELYGFIRE